MPIPFAQESRVVIGVFGAKNAAAIGPMPLIWNVNWSSSRGLPQK